MPYTVSSCFEKFRKDVVDLDFEQTKTARGSRDFVLANIARLSNEGVLPNVMGDYCLNFGSFSRRTKIRPLDDIDMMICYDGSCGVYDTIKKNELYHIRFADNHPFFDDLRNDDGRTLNSRKIINQLIGALSGVEKYSKAELHRRGEAASKVFKSPWIPFGSATGWRMASLRYARTFFTRTCHESPCAFPSEIQVNTICSNI